MKLKIPFILFLKILLILLCFTNPCAAWAEVPGVDASKVEVPTAILAGGCLTPWRQEFIQMMEDAPILLLDPTEPRDKRPLWEHTCIEKADILVVWFPDKGDCRGSLIELGRFLEQKKKPLLVGADPKSAHCQEVRIQLQIRPEVKLASSLEELAAQMQALVLHSAL